MNREEYKEKYFPEMQNADWSEHLVDLDAVIEGEVSRRIKEYKAANQTVTLEELKKTHMLCVHLTGTIKDLQDACHQKQEIIDGQKDYAKISLELEKLKEAGLKATELIAHFKDQMEGFNEVEQKEFDELIEVFGYQGPY